MDPRSAEHQALGSAIRQLREQVGLSQEALALEAGIDRSYVGGVERGERNPTYATLLRIAAVLTVPLSKVIVEAEGRGR